MSPAPLASVDAGTAFTCGVSDTGQGFCWGLNGLGELGNGTGVNSDVPVSVGGGLGFSWIDAGVEYACAVSLTGDDGYCWGDNDAFQLGNGTGVGSGTPVLVSGALDLASVSTGRAHTCAVTIEGDVYCWGLNLSGQLGDGTNFNTATPVRVVE
jgi:alpha-tubulin suppressor-like RCC1 family protein